MKIKFGYFKWLNNEPRIMEFEGTIEEWNELEKRELMYGEEEDDEI
jgi:hypothetical protein